jgi:hypothetical protein
MDFLADQFFDWRTFWLLTFVDCFSRGNPVIERNPRLTDERVAATPDRA